MSKSEKANKAEIKRTHYRNGRVYQEVPFVRGRINGVVREYHKNGILAKEVPTKDGLRHGVCKQWNNKGELLGTFEMNMGTGISKQWFQNGHLQFEASIVNETFTGCLRRWNEKGCSAANNGGNVSAERWRADQRRTHRGARKKAA